MRRHGSIVWLVLLLAGACTGGTESNTTPATVLATAPDPPPVTSDVRQVLGTQWIVDGLEIDGRRIELVVGSLPTITFGPDADQVNGTGGCNSYTGSVHFGAGRLQIRSVTATELACIEPAALGEQDASFLAALGDEFALTVGEHGLTLTNQDGSAAIAAVPATAPGAVMLREVLWVADTRIEGDVSSTLDVAGLEVVIRFKDDGTVGGFAGCNTYRGPYELEGDRVNVSGLAGTLAGCSGAKGELERFVLDVVSDPDGFTYRVAGDRLTIETDDGRGLGFIRTEAAAARTAVASASAMPSWGPTTEVLTGPVDESPQMWSPRSYRAEVATAPSVSSTVSMARPAWLGSLIPIDQDIASAG